MADWRDDERRFRGDRRDPETERRIDRLADRYRGSDERGYGGGERLGRDWERGDMRGPERSTRDDLIRSADEERFSRGREDFGSREPSRDWGDRRFRDVGRDRDMGRYADMDRDRWSRDSGAFEREEWRASPSGAFRDERREEPDRGRYGMGGRDFGEVPEQEDRPHYSLAGLHDLDDLSELRQRYSERRRHRDYGPRHGHGPDVENMEPLRTGYGTSTTRRDEGDRELGHGGMMGANSRMGAARPMGRGPKGYQRSDDRIREELCDRLMMSWMDAENVEILVRDGEVTLQGTVKSRDEKRAIEAVAESVLGVKDVHNTLRVQREGQVGPVPQERRAQNQEQTSVQKPGDEPLHS